MRSIRRSWPIVLFAVLSSSARADDPPAAVAPDPDAALRDVLRQVFTELNAEGMAPTAWPFTSLGQAQAKLGDVDGARASFDRAAEIAAASEQFVARRGNTVTYGTSPAHDLWRLAHYQAEAGLRDESRATLARALSIIDRSADLAIETLALIAREQAKLGDRDGARATLARAVEIDNDLRAHKLGEARRSEPYLAATRAAAGDYEGLQAMLDALRTSAVVDQPEKGAFRQRDFEDRAARMHAEIAQAIAETAGPEDARATLQIIAEDLDAVRQAEAKYFPLDKLAHAWAKLGDFDAAMAAARKIGEGPTGVDYDMRDGKPYAMVVIAGEQRRRGDLAGARKTLDEAYRTIVETPKMRGPDGRLYQVALAQIAAGDLDGARRSVAAIKPGRSPDALAILALAERRAGNEAAAQATFRRALEDLEYRKTHRAEIRAGEPQFPGQEPEADPEARWQASVLRERAVLEARRGDLAAALAAARSIEDEPTRRWAMSSVVTELAGQGRAAEALKQARALDPAETRAALNNVADGVLRYLWTREAAGGGKGR
jgi:tetratricopeptide (TPR) repeat protein